MARPHNQPTGSHKDRKVADVCTCRGCTLRKNRNAAELLRYRLSLLENKRNNEPGRKKGGRRRGWRRKQKSKTQNPNETPKTQDPKPKNSTTKSLLTFCNPSVVTKFTMRAEGIRWRCFMENMHWNFLATVMMVVGFFLAFPVVRGEVVNLGQGHELRVTRTQSAILIDSQEHQENMCSSLEYFSKKPLTKLDERISKWKELAQQMGESREVTLSRAKYFCPMVGGGGNAENPLKGPYPKWINHLPRNSPYDVLAVEGGEIIRCTYSFDANFIATRNRMKNDKEGQIRLFPKKCQNKLRQGMIFPKANYVTHIFKVFQSTNILSCAELCINQYERARLNATCSDKNQRYFDCPSTMLKCHHWSYNRKTNFCLLYLNEQILPEERKDSKYDTFNDKSGTAFDGITGPVHCGDLKQKEKLWMRSGHGRDNWIPIKGACDFDGEPKGEMKVFTECKESASMIKLLLSQMEGKVLSFKKIYKLTSPQIREESRRKRSHQAINYNLISPAIQKFLISAMTATVPNMAGFSSMILGPLIGTFLYLTSALVTIIVQLALDNQQRILNKGVIELPEKNLTNLNDEWEIWRTSNLLKMPGFENLELYETTYPLTGLANISEEVDATLESFRKILEQGNPILPKIAQEIGTKPFTFLALDEGEYIKKVYFFTKTNKNISKLQISVFLSLDQTIPFREGIVSGSDQTDSPTIQCGDIFRRSKIISKACFNKNVLGSPVQNKFLIGRELYIFKILGKKVIQILCPENSLTSFSSGIMIFLAHSSCKIHINGNLFFVGGKSKNGNFKIILEAQFNTSDIMVPLPSRLEAKMGQLRHQWLIQAVLVLGTNALFLISALSWLIFRLYRYKNKKDRPRAVRYNQPILLPMPDLKSTKFRLREKINDKRETRSNK